MTELLGALGVVPSAYPPPSPETAASQRFFAELAERREEPLLRKASGSLRFEIVDGRKTRRWLVSVDKGAHLCARGKQREVDRLFTLPGRQVRPELFGGHRQNRSE